MGKHFNLAAGDDRDADTENRLGVRAGMAVAGVSLMPGAIRYVASLTSSLLPLQGWQEIAVPRHLNLISLCLWK